MDNLCCYSETTFDLIVNRKIISCFYLVVCDDTDGFGQFNLMRKYIECAIKVEFYHVPENAIPNLIINEEKK
jgi:hypothetical protein